MMLRFFFCVVIGLGVGPMAAGAVEKPNVLFLFADDQSFEALGALGQVDVETPHLDRLAARSVRFSHAYNMGSWSGAVCVASRTMLNTGRYLWRAEAVQKTLAKERDEGRLWAPMMKAAGYQTFMTGKWHVSVPAESVFERTGQVRGGMPKTVDSAYNRPLADQPDGWSPSDPTLGGFWEGGKHWSEVTADDAVAYLGQVKPSAQPFFMYVAFNAPHDPRQAPQSFVDRYPLSRVVVPADFLPEYPHAEQMGSGRGLRDEKLAPFPRTERAVKVHRGEYFALITHLDEQIGRVLAALDESGKAEQTWIFFTADHGLAVGHHGLMGKQNMYEHSLRVPFLVAGPGVKPKVVEAPIYLQDVMATCLDLAGVEKPEHVAFQSLLPLVRGESSTGTAEPVYGAYLALQRAIVWRGKKLIVYPKAKVARFYDLTLDPEERQDLAMDPKQGGVMQDLYLRLLRLQTEMDDGLDLRAVFGESLATGSR
jgi:arylsulfatase A-like enzyme